MRRDAAEVVVIGAGFAGAATAFQLARRGIEDVAILEQEDFAGTHASGRNAGIGRETALPETIAALAAEGLELVRQPPPDLPLTGGFRPVGLLLLAGSPEAPELHGAGRSHRWLPRREVEARVPATAGGDFAGGVLGEHDGVVEPAALLQAYLRGAEALGARLLTGRRVTGFERQGRRIVAVETDRGPITTRVVVNAAGAWAREIAALADASRPPLRPSRRHLIVARAPTGMERSWPVVWDVSHGLYFRPEPPGLLLSPCDETEHPPGPTAVDPEAEGWLAEKVRRHLPGLEGARPVRSWSGLRTLTPDGNFVIGRDPLVDDFVWCAGLGGHGVTVSGSVGRLTALAVMGAPSLAAHAPERFGLGVRVD